MFFIQKAVLNIRRHKIKSMIMILACALIILFLFLYISGLEANVQQLADLPNAVEVHSRISNLNGTMTSGGLLIPQNTIDGLEQSVHVAELCYTVQLGSAMARIKKDEVQSMETGDLTFPLSMGVNTLSATSALSERNIDFLEGQGPGFLEGTEALYILRNQEMNLYDLALGDTIWLTLFYPSYPNDRYDLTYHWLGIFPVKIAGSYSELWDAAEENQPPQIVFPVKWLRKQYEQANITFFADSARFRVADPLELNAFKAEMKELRLMPVISQVQHSHRGNALTVNDETFVQAASRLTDNINLMRAFTPFICITVGLVGFVLSYLLLHSRKPEIAVMRSIGMSRQGCFTLLFLENAALNLIGSTVGVLSAMLFMEVSVKLTATVAGLFFVCYMAGTVAALKFLDRFSVMATLSALE